MRLAPALAALIALAACGGDQGRSGTRLPEVERLVLVTIDTLRADHTSSYGHAIATTPWLDRLAGEGIVFRRAYAQSATTKPSHASLFTGLYPVQHGVQNNTQVLDEEFVTLAEMMRAQGYQTAAFVSADAPLGGNVGQGFEHWDQPLPGDRQGPAGKLYRPAGETVDRAIDWLQANASSAHRLFLWVHVYDPHKPLDPPDEHRRQTEAMIAEIGRERYENVLRSRNIPLDADNYGLVVDYDAEIRYADEQLGRLHRTMEVFGLNRGALWVVTSDHGQGLGAHDWFGHSVQIYNAQLHVPLVFWFADRDVPPREVDQHVVELVDILPTLADLAGLDTTSQIVALRGRSIEPLLRGVAPRQPKFFAYAERSRYVDPNPNRLTKGNYEVGSRYAYQDLAYKYLLFTDGADELYDLRTDPYETANLIDDDRFAADAEQMRDLLTAMLREATTNRAVESVSEQEMERLRALGYIQ